MRRLVEGRAVRHLHAAHLGEKALHAREDAVREHLDERRLVRHEARLRAPAPVGVRERRIALGLRLLARPVVHVDRVEERREEERLVVRLERLRERAQRGDEVELVDGEERVRIARAQDVRDVAALAQRKHRAVRRREGRGVADHRLDRIDRVAEEVVRLLVELPGSCPPATRVRRLEVEEPREAAEVRVEREPVDARYLLEERVRAAHEPRDGRRHQLAQAVVAHREQRLIENDVQEERHDVRVPEHLAVIELRRPRGAHEAADERGDNRKVPAQAPFVAIDPNRPLGHALSRNGAVLYRQRRPSQPLTDQAGRERVARARNLTAYRARTHCAVREKPSISSRTSKPSSSGLLRCPPRLRDRSPLHQKSALSACGIGWRFLIEVIVHVLGANRLRHRHLVLAPCLFKRERPVERIGIFHRYDRGQRPAVLADREPLDDVEFLCVRRTEGIDVVILAACEPDRVDH